MALVAPLGGLYVLTFDDRVLTFDDRRGAINVRVEGQPVFDSTAPILKAALGGLALAYLAEDEAVPYIEADQAPSRSDRDLKCDRPD